MDNSLSNILKQYGSVFAVYDRNVEQYALEVASMAGINGTDEAGSANKANGTDKARMMALDAGEQVKTMDTVLSICRWLLDAGADRKSIVLAIGGGTVTDTVGFAASIYKRGIAYANIPTTLLAMVDAAIGGKTGVNIDGYKNMLGTFCQPEFTWVLPEALQTLPEREFRSGSAELLKTFLIADAKNYRKAVEVLSGAPTIGEMAPLISAAAAIKEKIVNEDPFEQGRRRVLNLGHTWAHAIEWWQSKQTPAGTLSHGEAVAIGIIRAAQRSEAEGIAKKGLADSLKADFKACGLPTELPCSEEELLPAMAKDKKSADGQTQFVLIEKPGKVL